jgi:hypothetical protein
MNQRIALAMMLILLCLGLILPTSGSLAQQKPAKKQIEGAWTLVSHDTITQAGTRQQNFGTNPKGVLILDGSGRFVYVIGRPDRPKFKSSRPARSQRTAEEFAVAAREFAANTGTWSVDEAANRLIRK